MTINKLDAIIGKFEEVHHQMPEYICLPPVMYDTISGVMLGYPTERLKIRGIPLRMVRFQREAEVILCGKGFDERYIVSPAGEVVVSENRPGSAAGILIRIAEAYTRYLYEADEILRSVGMTAEERDEIMAERVLIEDNYAKCCTLYELDEGAFIAKYGRYGAPDISEFDVLMEALVQGGVTDD